MPSPTRRMLTAALLLGTASTLALLLTIGSAVDALRTTLARVASSISVAPITSAESSALPSSETLRTLDEDDAPASEAACEEAVSTATDGDQAVRASIEADPDLAALIEDPDPAVRSAMHDFIDGRNDHRP